MKKIIALLFFPLLFGCVTTGPTVEQVGYGRFAQMRTLGNNLLVQTPYNTSLDCELNLRAYWSDISSNQMVSKCSSEDLSSQLKYRIVVLTAKSSSAATVVHFAIPELCEATANVIQTKGNETIETHCK